MAVCRSDRPRRDPMQAVNLAEETDIRAAVDAASVLIQLEADFAHDGQLGQRTSELTSETVRVHEAGGAVSLQIPIAEIKSARNEPLVDGGRLELVTITGEIIPIISYSLTLAHKFSE